MLSFFFCHFFFFFALSKTSKALIACKTSSVYHVGVLINALLYSSSREPVYANEQGANGLHAFCVSYHK